MTSTLLTGEYRLEVLVFALVVGACTFLFLAWRSFQTNRDSALEGRIDRALADPASGAATARTAAAPQDGSVFEALKSITKVVKPSTEEEVDSLRAKLSHAGYRSERALTGFLLSKLVLCFGAAGAIAFYNSLRPEPLARPALYTIVAMIVGFYAPSIWLHGRVQERQQALARALPNILDMLVTCVEAGLGIDAALNRVATDSPLSTGLLADELRHTALEMRAGFNRSEAMRRLAARTGLPDLRYLALVMVQSEIFGTSIAKALRTMADSLRVRRMQDAERRAATAAVKMTLPLVMCILPSLFTILLGPAVVNVARTLLPALGGK